MAPTCSSCVRLYTRPSHWSRSLSSLTFSLEPLTYVTLLLLLAFRLRVFQSAALALIGAFLISYAFYFFAQSFVDRPHIGGEDVLARMLRDVYSADNPYNDFPSLHTSISAILAI